jgi:hypothetical protein
VHGGKLKEYNDTTCGCNYLGAVKTENIKSHAMLWSNMPIDVLFMPAINRIVELCCTSRQYVCQVDLSSSLGLLDKVELKALRNCTEVYICV